MILAKTLVNEKEMATRFLILPTLISCLWYSGRLQVCFLQLPPNEKDRSVRDLWDRRIALNGDATFHSNISLVRSAQVYMTVRDKLEQK